MTRRSPASFKDVMRLWDTREALARELGVAGASVHKWFERDSIPVAWWCHILKTSIARDRGLTVELFMRLAAHQAAAR